MKRVGKVRSMVFKPDMSKAFDRVKWGFLQSLMVRMEFPESYIALIFNCICTISYTVLVNGEKHDPFEPKSGVRQGDPLSPYLFLLCNEGLACLLKCATKNKLLHGLSASYRRPQMSHLFFVKDYYFVMLLFLIAKLFVAY